MLYCGEESGLNPSHQIYFSGCNLACEFCVAGEWNEQPTAAPKLNVEQLKQKIEQRKKQGARTLNLLGGEPAVNLYGILELLSQLDCDTKVVWNSNMYYSDIVDEMTAGLVDVYLADFKCGNNRCAARMLGAADYVEVVKRNILKAQRQGQTIIRHLLLPGHSECCLKPILDWLAKELPDVRISLRGDYIPPVPAVEAPAEYVEQEQLQAAVEMAEDVGLSVVQ
jgi:putative pyruvate formate lyase activating enzyme